MIRALMVLCVMLWTGAAHAVGVDEAQLPDPVQEARARDLMKELRCLVCQNQSIDESDADLAKDLRIIVRERIAAGDSDADVRRFLVARYGDWILLDPPLKARTLVLWLGPFALVILAGAVIWWRSRHRMPVPPPAPLSAEEQARLQALLAAADQEQERTA